MNATYNFIPKHWHAKHLCYTAGASDNTTPPVWAREKKKIRLRKWPIFCFTEKNTHILHNNFSSWKYMCVAYRIHSFEMFEKKFYRLQFVEFFYSWCCAIDMKLETKNKIKIMLYLLSDNSPWQLHLNCDKK